MDGSLSSDKIPLLNGETFRKAYGTDAKQTSRLEGKNAYGFIHLMRDCGTLCDKIFLAIGYILVVLTGFTFPVMGLLYGTAASVFVVHKDVNFNKTGNASRTQRSSFGHDTTEVLILFLGLTAVQIAIGFFSSMAILIPSARIVNGLRKRFLRHIVRADMSYLQTQRTGELNAMFHDHMERVLEAFCLYGYGVVLSVSGAFFGIIISLFINWKQTLCAGTLMPVVALVGVYAMRVVVRKVEEEQDRFGKAAGLIEETLSSIGTVLSFNGQKQTLKRFGTFLENANTVSASRAMIEGLANGINIFVADSMGGVAFLFGAFFVAAYQDPASRGMFYTVAINLLMTATLAYNIQAPLSSFLGAKANLASIGHILLTEPEIDSMSTVGERLSISQHDGATIEFRNVSFFYPARPDVKVLNGVSFTVSAGEHVAIVGSSGAGKSTIANLILRFYEANAGVIMVNGRPLTSLNVQSWRQSIGYVSQDAPMFDGTVEENIRFGYPEATRAEVIECIRQADLNKFIDEMPDGYDTWVGDKGVQLSGGQRQRVAIARALIREPAVFVFDEATSSLDSVTEQTVVGEIENVVRGKTTVTIAHRLSTIRNADRIIVLDQGNIVEQGDHVTLMKKGTKYAHMVHMQELYHKGTNDDEWSLPLGSAGGVSSYSETSDPEMYWSDASRRKLSRRYRTVSTTDGGISRLSADTGSLYEGLHHQTMVAGSMSKKKLLRSRTRDLSTVAIKEEEDEAEKHLEKQKTNFAAFFRMFTRGDWCKLSLSFFGSLIYSIGDTACTIAFSSLLVVLPLPLDQMRVGVIWVSLVNVSASVVTALSRTFFTYWHTRFGDEASGRMRILLFTKLLRHNLPFYDRPENSSGALSTILVKNPAKMRKAINQDMLLMPSAVWSFVLRLVISLWINVPFTLICMLMIPSDIIIYTIANLVNLFLELKVQPEQEKAGKVATETIDHLQTVQAYSLENIFCARYEERLKPILRGFIKQGAMTALFMAIISSTSTFYSGLIIKIGATFVSNGAISAVELWIVFMLVGTMSEQLALLLSQSQDVVRALVSAAKAINIINQPIDVDCMSDIGLRPTIGGGIKLKNVRFAYPSRPDTNVLSDVTANIKNGKTLAIVGPSGSGKSTIMHLLQRLYDPTKGKIEIDGYSMENINIKCLRNHIVPVKQEPVLFDGTIRENIMYGLDDVNADDYHLFNASRMANIHDFVSSLPEGYNTDVGAKGVQLSGGQRQRIAIARALVRNPKVLLLDEATASLDTENEQAVQAALEVARKERTCVVVAHRLSTVQSAHMILVMVDGRIVERGNHRALLEKQGVYYDLCLKQNLAR